jgi:hypothetical protein
MGAAKNGIEHAEQVYLLPQTHHEIERLKNQHEWIKGAFGGLIKAPISFFKQHQKILDSATADGNLKFLSSSLATILCAPFC